MLFSYFALFCASYQSFSEKIQTQTFSGKSGEELELFTPNSPFLATVSFIDLSKVEIKVASPLQSDLMDIKLNRSFFFPKGKSKFVINFKEESSVIFNYASISEDACPNGISVIINETHELNINSYNDECYFFAFASFAHRFKVIENGLQSGSTLCAFHDSINGNAYQCYQKENPIDSSFIPADGSPSPWLFIFTKSLTSKSLNHIKISLQAPQISTISSATTSFIGNPTKFNDPPIANYHKNWWMPIVGSIAPTFLLISWIYTFIHLFKKRNSTII